MRTVAFVASVVMVGAAMYYAWPADGGTAGDDESNNLLDAVDTMTSKINGGWPSGSAPYKALIEWAAGLYGVPALLLAWLLWKESRFSPEVINGTRRSRVGALGIAQFMPATAREELGSEAAALDPEHAVPGAARYLARLYRATGTWKGALAAYNWGIGNVQRKGLAAAPAETRDYFTVILNRAGEYA